jgi:hypothetical protein
MVCAKTILAAIQTRFRSDQYAACFQEIARGSVSRVLSSRLRTMCDHSSRTVFAHGLKQPTRTTEPSRPICRPYSVLLQVGFAVPLRLPVARCAFTAPFRPCHAEALGSKTYGGLFSVALSLDRELLPDQPGIIRHLHSMEPGLSSPQLLARRSPNPLTNPA